jgi:prepilin-type processing-associated H-X9-DG protein
MDPLFFPQVTNDPGVLRPILESEIISPSQMIAIGDSVIWQGILNNQGVVFGAGFLPKLSGMPIMLANLPLGSSPSYSLNPMDKATLARHRGRWNMLFTDGHVQSGKTAQFFTFTDDTVLKMWNRDHEAHRLP